MKKIFADVITRENMQEEIKHLMFVLENDKISEKEAALLEFAQAIMLLDPEMKKNIEMQAKQVAALRNLTPGTKAALERVSSNGGRLEQDEKGFNYGVNVKDELKNVVKITEAKQKPKSESVKFTR